VYESQKQVAAAAPTAPTPALTPSSAPSLALENLEWHVSEIACPKCGKAGRAQKPRKQADMYIIQGSGSDRTSCHLNPSQTVSLLPSIIASQWSIKHDQNELKERDNTIAELRKKLKTIKAVIRKLRKYNRVLNNILI
jgi:predicted RNA-binding Zn-ribbon protein involved in translation (DUF1610 family)